MAEMILFSILRQTAEPGGMTANQTFLLEVLKLVIPVVTGVLSIAAAYLAYLKSREVKHEVGVLQEQHVALKSEIDGKMTRLLATTERAAHAEGVAEGVAAAATAPIVQPQVVIVPPDVKPGGHRRTDPPAPVPPPAPPVEGGSVP